jgi:hypothetical protein
LAALPAARAAGADLGPVVVLDVDSTIVVAHRAGIGTRS